MKKKQSGKHSIHDIAKMLRLSPATISRVLNNHPHVRQATRKRVMSIIEEMGYKRNAMASGLRTNKTRTVGLIVPRIAMYVHAEIITTIQNELHALGYSLIICQSNDSLELEQELTRTLYASRVDAVIASCTLFTTDFSHFDVLTNNNIPVIFYDRVPIKPYPAAIVRGDDFRGGYLAASHLIELGCKRIAYISGPLQCSIYTERFAGFKKALQQNDIPLLSQYVFYHELNVDNARHTLKKIFGKKPFPDAIFAANDVTALEVLNYAREMNIQVPGDLKIVGYSNDPRAAIVSPSLTTIEQYPAHTGKVIVTELFKLLNNGEEHTTTDFPQVVTAVGLIRRMST